MLKTKYKGKSIIIPIKLAHFEYDDGQNKIKDTAAISRMICAAIREYDILPDGDAEFETEPIYQLVSMSSDAPYLHKKDINGDPQIISDIQSLIYTGPLCSGWKYDGAHELELVRKDLLNTNTDHYYWIESISAGLSILTRPKWSTTTINVAKRCQLPPRKFQTLSQTRFWSHFGSTLRKIFLNLNTAYYVFVVLQQNTDLAKTTLTWREEWQSMQWALFLMLNIDVMEAMEVLSFAHQTSVDIAPFFITYNLEKAQTMIQEDIQSLETLLEIITNLRTNQFDSNYNITMDIENIPSLSTTKHNLKYILKFQWDQHQLSSNNLFTDLYTNTIYSRCDATQFLTQEEEQDIFGDIEESTDYDTSSDYAPTDIEEKENEMDEQILNEYENRISQRNNQNTYRYDACHDYIYIGNCNGRCDADTWIKCDGCGGWKCYSHISEDLGIDLERYEPEFIEGMSYLCDICLKLIKDPVNMQIKYVKDFHDKYYGPNGVRSETVMNENLDSKWVGLSIDVLMENCMEEKWDIDGIKVNVLNDEEKMNEGKIEFLRLSNYYLDKCENTKFQDLFYFDNMTIINSFISLKKQMLRYIITHIQDYLDLNSNDITTKKLKQFRKNMFHFIDKQINTNNNYVQIKTLWNLSVAELQSEAIVESICSSLKKIYTPDRNKLKQITLEILIQLRLSLPISKKQRDEVIKKVIEKYHEEHPTQITHKVRVEQKQRRQVLGISVSKAIDEAQNEKNTAFTVPFD